MTFAIFISILVVLILLNWAAEAFEFKFSHTNGVISTYPDYLLVSFIRSGTLVPLGDVTAQVLIVGGGGAGGDGHGHEGAGGGGAGGLGVGTLKLRAGVAYSITVGAGGSQANQFGGISSIIGGQIREISFGGGFGSSGCANSNGQQGGSGSGASGCGNIQQGGQAQRGSGSLVYFGTAGGDGPHEANGGGGGGAGSVGASGSQGGNGGSGYTWIQGETYAAGGGGGGSSNGGGGGFKGSTGGKGGSNSIGGNGGAPNANGFPAAVNTGSGGGGAGSSYYGGNRGGSGSNGVVMFAFLPPSSSTSSPPPDGDEFVEAPSNSMMNGLFTLGIVLGAAIGLSCVYMLWRKIRQVEGFSLDSSIFINLFFLCVYW